jgi:hypothetical protein
VKSFLILVLSTVLAIGAFLSRPTEENFRAFVRQKMGSANVPAAMMNENAVGSMMQGCSYHDRFVYSTIEINGKTVYAGVFSRWFSIPETASAAGGKEAGQPAGISAF